MVDVKVPMIEIGGVAAVEGATTAAATMFGGRAVVAEMAASMVVWPWRNEVAETVMIKMGWRYGEWMTGGGVELCLSGRFC